MASSKKRPPEVIELLDDSSDDGDDIIGEIFGNNNATDYGKKKSTPREEQRVIEIPSDDDDNEEEEKLCLLGSCEMSVVGIRHYNGTAHPGEYVALVREPHNPYDCNAIRIDNMRGQKVGHIKRDMAERLAPLLDDHRHNNYRVYGTIPRPGNSWNLPVEIEIYHAAALQQTTTTQRDEREHGFAMELLTRDLEEQFRGFSFARGGSSAVARAANSTEAAVVVERKVLDWKTQQKELDDMFEKQMEERLKGLPEIPKMSLLHGDRLLKDHVRLFPYQKQGIQWMVLQEEHEHQKKKKDSFLFYSQIVENNRKVWFCDITNCSQADPPKSVKGGILADEMGLGKTIQTIGLMLLNPPNGCEYHQRDTTKVQSKQHEESTPKKQPNAAMMGEGEKTISKTPNLKVIGGTKPVCTLIVCPVTIMSNWVQQIEAHVKPGLLNIALYQGNNRTSVILPRLEYNDIDVLIVSYHTLAADYTARGDDKQAATKKKKKAKKRKRHMKSILDIPFHRVILDEAHTIRSSKTKLFQAVSSIQADRRFCLTGTPFINRADDIYSLLAFLRMEPITDHHIFRRAITLPIQSNKDIGLARLRTIMSHIALRRTKASVWDDIKQHTTKKEIELRRVSFPEGKGKAASSIHKTIHDTLFNTAKIIFQAMLQQQQDDGDDDEDDNRNNNNNKQINYFSIVEILLRIRQACCNADLLVPKHRLDCAREIARQLEERMVDNPREGPVITPEEGKQLLQKLVGAFQPNDNATSNTTMDGADIECSICLCDMDEGTAVILRTCSHIFCESCISRVINGPNNDKKKNKTSNCPLCRKLFSKNDMIHKKALTEAAEKEEEERKQREDKENEDTNAAVEKKKNRNKDNNVLGDDDYSGETMESILSPKVQALLDAIEEMQSDEKGVIFSQFTKFLDIIQKALRYKGHSYTRIDGSMNAQQRMKAISDFNNDGNNAPRFVLCSLHAAGTGVNLTRGNVVYMMDCWWNQAAEHQAMDRVHRIGQTRDVRIVRFVMKDSIEEKMMIRLQESKALLGKGAMEKLTAEEKRQTKLTLIRDLFCAAR